MTQKQCEKKELEIERLQSELNSNKITISKLESNAATNLELIYKLTKQITTEKEAAINSKASCSDIQETLQSVSNGIKQKINDLSEEQRTGFTEIQRKQTSISTNIELSQDIKGRLETLSDRFEKYVQQSKTLQEIAKKNGIKLWLETQVKLPQYFQNFIQNDITMEIVSDLTMDILKRIGIDSVGHQLQILHHIKKYQHITINDNSSTNIDNKSIENLLKQQHDDTIQCVIKQNWDQYQSNLTEKEKKNISLQNAVKDITKCLLIESPEQYLPAFQQKCNELREYVESEHNGNKITFIDEEDKPYKARINEYIKLNKNRNNRDNRIEIMIINQKDKKSAIKQSDVIETYKIKHHQRIPQLNGQNGLRAKQCIGKATVIGEYSGPYILNSDLEKLEGTRLYNKINAYAFEDNIEVKMSLNNVRYFLSSNEERKQMENEMDIDEEEDIEINQIQQPSLKRQRLNDGTSKERNHNNNNHNIDDLMVIIQEFRIIIDGWSSKPKSMLCFMNDCRKYFELSRRTEDDNEYFNVKFVTIQYNGWPRVFAVAIRDIDQNEELLSFYGANFVGVQKQSEKLKRRDDELKLILTSVGMN